MIVKPLVFACVAGWVWGSLWYLLTPEETTLAANIIFLISCLVVGVIVSNLSRILWPPEE